jgi:putative CocE/NonD family hydrolase
VPREVYELHIDMEVTSNVFATGHRVRLDVSSSNFPRLDANPNTGALVGTEVDVVVARQRILHDGAHRSHVLLPVIPPGQAGRPVR